MSIQTSIARVAGEIQAQTGLIAQLNEGLATAEENYSKTVTEINNQSTIIQQIKTALEDRAAGGVELPTLENPGYNMDLREGKQLIDAEGNIVEGHIPVAESLIYISEREDLRVENGRLFVSGGSVADVPIIIEPNYSEIGSSTHLTAFGNASASDVAKGVTFTSASGLLVEGTHECEEGITLPTLENPGTADDLVQGKQLIRADGGVVTGKLPLAPNPLICDSFDSNGFDPFQGLVMFLSTPSTGRVLLEEGTRLSMNIPGRYFGTARPEDVREGVTFTSESGLNIEGTATLGSGGSGGFIYPEGAFAPVTSFTDGKQYALVSMIGGVRRYLNTTTYNNYTMNATQVAVQEDAGDYVIFSTTPALFTAVASGNGFLLQNGNNYLHGTTTSGTALRVGTTQAVWTVDNSETGGFSAGKYNAKEDPNAVWLFNSSGGYNWSIKYETAGSFGYDRDGRDNTYSTGFTPFVLYEYVAGEGEVSPVCDTSDATATASDMAEGVTAYVNGRKVTGTLMRIGGADTIAADVYKYSDNSIAFSVNPFSNKFIVDKDFGLKVRTDFQNLGDATAADVRQGKTFTSAAGLKVTGTATIGSTGSTIKSGTTTNRAIDTGLSEIEEFFIYKESQTATGLIHLHYTKTATSRMYASAWSTNNYGTKTITNGTGGVTVSGGTITISATQAAQGALSSGVTYKWVAIGKE